MRRHRKRKRKAYRKTNGYLRAGYTLLFLMTLLAVTAFLLWRIDRSASPDTLPRQEQASLFHDAERSVAENKTAAGPDAIRQETTLYENTLPDDPDGGFVAAGPQNGIVTNDEPAAKEDADTLASGEESTPEGETGNGENAAPDAQRTGRVIFVGDSRTIDMFADSDTALYGEQHDGIRVYANHGKGYSYLESVCKNGAEKASYIANKTLRKVYKKVGFVAKIN